MMFERGGATTGGTRGRAEVVWRRVVNGGSADKKLNELLDNVVDVNDAFFRWRLNGHYSRNNAFDFIQYSASAIAMIIATILIDNRSNMDDINK